MFTSELEDELWERWARGDSSRLIAQKLRSTPHAVRAVLARHGGVRPPTRARGKQQLTAAEREEISRGIAAGLSSRAIAAALGRSPSTVSREIARNGGRRRYRAAVADAATWERARRPKTSRLATSPELLAAVPDPLWDSICVRVAEDDVSAQIPAPRFSAPVMYKVERRWPTHEAFRHVELIPRTTQAVSGDSVSH